MENPQVNQPPKQKMPLATACNIKEIAPLPDNDDEFFGNAVNFRPIMAQVQRSRRVAPPATPVAPAPEPSPKPAVAPQPESTHQRLA